MRNHMVIKKILEKLNNKAQKCGHTLMELMIAISIISILVPLIFMAYLSIYKQFKYNTNKADRVMETVVIKKKIDRLITDIENVNSTYKTSFGYFGNRDNKTHLLSFRGNTLCIDNKIKINKVKTFNYLITEKKSASGRHLLLWEVILESGNWIAGAKVIGFK